MRAPQGTITCDKCNTEYTAREYSYKVHLNIILDGVKYHHICVVCAPPSRTYAVAFPTPFDTRTESFIRNDNSKRGVY